MKISNTIVASNGAVAHVYEEYPLNIDYWHDQVVTHAINQRFPIWEPTAEEKGDKDFITMKMQAAVGQILNLANQQKLQVEIKTYVDYSTNEYDQDCVVVVLSDKTNKEILSIEVSDDLITISLRIHGVYMSSLQISTIDATMFNSNGYLDFNKYLNTVLNIRESIRDCVIFTE